MDADELKKLRQYYHSLLKQQSIIEQLGGNVIQGTSLIPLELELQKLDEDFPSIILKFDKHNYFSHTTPVMSGGKVMYSLTAIQLYLATVLGRLQVAIEQPENIPITEKRKFTFVENSDLRTIIERDYEEIQRAFISGCWKSVIILCGGAIETILTDILSSNETLARNAKTAPKERDIMRWDLSALIAVAVELHFVSEGVEKLSHSLREYRNLVHPGNELRNRLRFDAEEARIAVEVLNIVHRDLLERTSAS